MFSIITHFYSVPTSCSTVSLLQFCLLCQSRPDKPAEASILPDRKYQDCNIDKEGEDGSTSQWKKTMKSLPLSCRASAQSQTSVIIFIRSSSSKSRGLPTTNCNYLTDCSLPLQSFAANLLQETELLLMCFVKVHTTAKISHKKFYHS